MGRKKPDGDIRVFWKIMYALALAEALNRAPFPINLHKMPYKHYRCVWCWGPTGTRKPCEGKKGKL